MNKFALFCTKQRRLYCTLLLPVLSVCAGVVVEAQSAVVVPPLEGFAEDGVGHVHRHHLLHRRLGRDHVGVELHGCGQTNSGYVVRHT